MRYRIFPSIGIARVGQDPDFFLGPEQTDRGPIEMDGALVTRFKDAESKKVRKQGARFHLYQSEDGLAWVPAVLPAESTVTWTVELQNKKAAVDRPDDPPIAPMRPVVLHEERVIKGGRKEVTGRNAARKDFIGKYRFNAFEADMNLGSILTDSEGRLIVLGGDGSATAPAGTRLGPPYYKNPGWADDVADGPVTASIVLAPGADAIEAEGGAWVITAPPDYAPSIDCIVTLYDVLHDVGKISAPGTPSFARDIEPMLTRVRRLRWVHENPTWASAELLDPNLGNTSDQYQPLRRSVRDIVLHTESVFRGHEDPAGPRFELRPFQRAILEEWVNGNFTQGFAPAGVTAEGLTRAALDATAGQGFCPGIEGGILLTDSSLYTAPFDFRIDHTAINAGDVTALMAQPWQADFLKCHTEWWPIQRPDLAPQTDETTKDWIRGVSGHRQLLERYPRLGFVVVQQGENEVFVESERDSTLPEF